MPDPLLYVLAQQVAPPNARETFQNYLGACIQALQILEYRGRVPEGTTDTVRADVLELAPDQQAKALMAQLRPDTQHWARFADQELRERPERVARAGEGLLRPPDM